MAGANGSAQMAPSARVLIAGRDLSPAASGDLIALAVYDDVEIPSMFTLKLLNWDMERLKVTWSDAADFAIGSDVQIQLGYVDNLKTVLTGEVTGLEPEFSATAPPQLIVRGYDRRHRLLRGRKTRTFLQLTDSAIAQQIAAEAQLSAQVTDSGVKLEYVLQHSQSDLEFLQSRARRIGYAVSVQDKTLYFRPRQSGQSATLTLARDDDLIEFYPRLTTMAQGSGVQVTGWDVKQKRAIMANAQASDVADLMGGRVSGPQAVQQTFGQARFTWPEQLAISQEEANGMASGQLNEMALAYIQGEGLCVGRTDLRADTVVRIEGFGERFSGQYYIRSVTHRFLPNRGYRTSFSFRRSAA